MNRIMNNFICCRAAALLLAVGLPNALHAEQVSDAGEFGAALENAGPGTILVLAGGNYGSLSIRNLRGTPGAPIVIRSADPADPAQFSGMVLRDSAHVVLEDVIMDYAFADEDKLHFRPFQVLSGQDITLRHILFDGDTAHGVSTVDDGFGYGFGLGVTDVSGFALEDSEVRGFFRGIVFGNSTDIVVRGNDLHDIRMDGMNFAQVNRVLIEDNHIHDFNRSLASEDHADMIQFWTNGTDAPSTDITIRGNILNSGGGWYTQSIFMRNDQVDRGLAGPAMFYRNVRIEDNVILNAHLHGITVGETDGLTIANNSVLRNAASEGEDDNPGLWTPQIRVAAGATDVEIARNVVARISVARPKGDSQEGWPAGWRITDNLMVQDRGPSQPGWFYSLVFAGVPGGDTGHLETFYPKSGGPLDGAELGAARLRP
jgi:Right handed beta helix region